MILPNIAVMAIQPKDGSMSDSTFMAAASTTAPGDQSEPLDPLPEFCEHNRISRYLATRLCDQGRLEHVWVGSRRKIPRGAYGRLIKRELAKNLSGI